MTETTELADELFALMMAADPLDASLYGISGYDDRLPDLSEEGEVALRAAAADVAARARALATGDPVTRAVVAQQAEAIVDRLDARSAEYTITASFFAPAGALLTILPMVAVTTPEQGRDYLLRLAAVPGVLDVLAERHRAGLLAGRLPVAHLVRDAIAFVDRYLATSADEDPLARQEHAEPGFTAERDRLLAEAVRPAYRRYRDVLEEEVLPAGRPEGRPGLCWLPDGAAIYSALARVHTTTSRTPDELHETGLALMAELAEEYAVLGQRVFGTSDQAEIFDRMRTDPELRWRDAEEMLGAARDTVTRAEAAAPEWFGTLPDSACVVAAVPETEAPGAPTAYYSPGAMDGSRPGTYYANTSRARERHRYQSEAIAFHEAVPGHHFQITLAQGLTGLPMLRRLAAVTAYLEGWGLYCERLADEMGLYSDDTSRLGMLSLDSMRAGRLVVDTGLHALGWSRAQAVDYLRGNTPLPLVEIESEVDRYIAAPGQALAYMVGRLEIQRIRAEAERALGDDFDIRAFHDLVLAGGPLPLAVLDEVVTAWSASAVVV
ncbi:DUF885 domain-containing protein [Umezawaea tangerina]|uniref:Uncharacterized protein (DUF885 family) n=1 Tax=Umezawaea tangerina TaxID=84725 RepID=A0A2T0TME3_9PSEU|nr:DUF885 domain-containing protein [Umezawaea tangerina]PRY46688.1 uncharacterized protein (DUF885 family) [Umezawaea tangerina]